MGGNASCFFTKILNILNVMMKLFIKFATRATIFLLLSVFGMFSYAETFSNPKPGWVSSPDHAGFISVVGFAPKQANVSEAMQQRFALTQARHLIAQLVRVRVEHNSEEMRQVKNGSATHTADSFTRVSSNVALNLKNAEVTKKWIDPVSGDLYLLLELQE